ncbi:MAG: O-antigen ligase family protein [Acidobacteria bacterium]|nr:O-antigen ligase family protein [Acidobacteriota bacterium]
MTMTVLAVTACSLGWMIASENWLFVVGVFGLLLLLVRPIEVALGLYAFLIPFETMTTLGNSTDPSDTLLRYVGLLALFVILSAGLLRERIIRPPQTALFWSLFILWGGVSSLWAIDQTMALKRLPTAVGLWLLYMAVVSLRITDKELSWISLLTVLGGTGASIYSVYMFSHSGGAPGRVSLAEGSTQSDPNFFAVALLLPLSLSFGGVLSSRTWPHRVLFLASTGAIAFAVFLTMSRGALAAVAVITFVFLLRLRLNWRLFLPVIVAGTALLFMPRLFFERVQEASTSRMAGRQDIWLIGIHSLRSYGIFGAGLDNFSNAFERYVGSSRFFAGDQRASHNIYLTVAVEFGILGTLFLFGAVRSHMRAFPRVTRNIFASSRLVAFEAACWGMLAAGFGLDILWRKAFWFTWALSVGALHVQRENEELCDPGSR